MEEKESDILEYSSDIMKCSNCTHWKLGKCYHLQSSDGKEGVLTSPNDECKCGLFEPVPFKKQLKECYDTISNTLEYFMDIDEEVRNIVTLWIIGTYFHNNFQSYSYLFLNAMRGSGKTRLMRIINAYSKRGQMLTSLTEATMFRTVGTLCIDEFEGLGSKDKNSLRELLNSSYKKGSKVFRMKKKKSIDGEEQVVEEFEPYRPICMANIWGMEEVLGDRCITLVLEKSSDSSKINLVENFDDDEKNNYTKNLLNSLSQCSLCRCSYEKNIYKDWNDYVKYNYTNYTTTPTTLNYTKLHHILFEKIIKSGIGGRYLELFLPLFLIANDIEDEILLDKTIEYAKGLVSERKSDEYNESQDVLVYRLVSKESNEFKPISEITNIFRLMLGEGNSDWLNSKWMGRALKRLNLVKEKRRMSEGMQVVLNVEKAIKKLEMFK